MLRKLFLNAFADIFLAEPSIMHRTFMLIKGVA